MIISEAINGAVELYCVIKYFVCPIYIKDRLNVIYLYYKHNTTHNQLQLMFIFISVQAGFSTSPFIDIQFTFIYDKEKQPMTKTINKLSNLLADFLPFD